MMADFVCNNVRLRKIARRVELAIEVVIKAEVDVDLLIGPALERTHPRVAGTTCRRILATIHHELGCVVLLSDADKLLRPDVFRICQDDLDELQ